MRSPLSNSRSAALVAGALACLAYANSLSNGFAYDDTHIIFENPALHSLETLPGAVFKPYWHGHEGETELGLWRPTTTLVLGLTYALSGENPFLYHLVNVVGHGIATALAVLVLAQLMTLPAALAAGLLFAVHPVHVEAVANVVGGAEVLAALFTLAALLVHLRGPSTWGRAAAVAALYALAFGTKESAVTLPALVLLVDAARRRLALTDVRAYVAERWRTYAAMAGIAATMLTVRLQVLGSVANPEAALGGRLLLEVPRVWTLAEVWTHYVRLMVFPLDLASDYSPAVIPVSLGWGPANTVGLVLALGLLIAALVSWRRGELGPASESPRAFGFGVLWFVFAILPVANLFFLSGVLLAERTLYLPSVGAVAILGWAAVWLAGRRREAGVAVVAIALTLMAARTWTRTPTWASDQAVFETLILEHPESGRAQWLMADTYMAQGRQSEALRAYREAIPDVGAHYGLHVQIGRHLLSAGNLRGAARLLELVRLEAPDFPTGAALLGVAYARLGDADRAEPALRDAVRLQPQNLISHHLLAGVLGDLGRYGEAAEVRRRVIGMGEDVWQQWTSLAELEARDGDFDAARAALDSARVRAQAQGAGAQVDSLAAWVDRLEREGAPGA